MKRPSTEQTLEVARNAAARAEAEARAQRRDLEKQLKIARGTRSRAQALTDEVLRDRIEHFLREAPCSIAALARKLIAPVGRVSAVMAALKQERRVYNIGEDTEPRWIWIVGDNGPTPELIETVRRLLELRPFSFAELRDATGARRGRVSGAIVKLQAAGFNVENAGTVEHYLWCIAPRRERARSHAAAASSARHAEVSTATAPESSRPGTSPG